MVEQTEKTSSSSEFTIVRLTIQNHNGTSTYEIPAMYSELNIYEDIYSPVITGSITILDSIDLFDKLPMIGEEGILIEFKSNDTGALEEVPSFNKKFEVYAISSVKQHKVSTKTYTLKFASTEFKKNMKLQISKSYENKKVSEIVEDVLTSPYPYGLGVSKPSKGSSNLVAQAYRIETTLNTQTIIVPYWKPFELFSYLSSKAISFHNSNTANYLFFENRDGFNFISLDRLIRMQRNPHELFYFSQAMIDSTSRFDKSRIIKLDILDPFNSSNNIENGMHGATLSVHDLETKTQTTIAYEAPFNEVSHLEKNSFATTQAVNLNGSSYQRHHTSSPNADITNSLPMKRDAQMQVWDNLKLSLLVPGYTGRTVGQVIHIDYPKIDDESKLDTNDIFSGLYVITAIHHHLKEDDYFQTIEVAKDSISGTI